MARRTEGQTFVTKPAWMHLEIVDHKLKYFNTFLDASEYLFYGKELLQLCPAGDNAEAEESNGTAGKKTKGRVKIKMEFIDNKLRRYTTFSKRKTGIMKKVRAVDTQILVVEIRLRWVFF